MNDIAVRTFTEWGMKRIEIYPFGDKGFQAHIDIDFVLLDKDGFIYVDIGKISFGISMKRADIDEANRFSECMRLACEVARRMPQPGWPTCLTTDEVLSVLNLEAQP